jgi:parallel beta-helix repeat protein
MYYDTASPDTCTDNIVTNNYAYHCGELNVCSFGWGSGICLSGRRNVASHNLVHDTAYNAFNFDGWDNVIEYNYIHHSSLEIDDCGGIYGWGNTRGGSGRNMIRFNRIADSIGYGKERSRPGRYQSPWMSFGIYLDDYLSNNTIFGNLVYRAYNGCLNLHGGWNNTVENNIFVDGARSQVQFSNMLRNQPTLSGATGKDAPGTGEWAMSGIVLRCNILVSVQPQAKIYAGSGFEDRTISETDSNLAWNQGQPIQIGIPDYASEDAWGSWQATGRDVHSLVADPLFVDPAHDDYRLRPGSPALKLGFKPLPIGEMGLVQSPERASWPVIEPQIIREALLSPLAANVFSVPSARATACLARFRPAP